MIEPYKNSKKGFAYDGERHKRSARIVFDKRIKAQFFSDNKKKLKGLEDFFSSFDGRAIEVTDDLLVEFSKDGLLDEAKKRELKIILMSKGRRDIYGENDLQARNRIYGDTAYQMILDSNGYYGACLGFEPQEKSLLVVQMQGAKKENKGEQLNSDVIKILKPIKWPNLLLRSLEIEAQRVKGIERLFVLPAKRNKWLSVNTNLTRTAMYYDITAERSGYRFDDAVGLWVKELG